MNTPSTAPRDLDQFESALLTELRGQVAARPEPAAVPALAVRPHHRRWAAGLAVAAAAATAFVVGFPGGPAVNPAFAVAQEADGEVVATIHELEDAAGLEEALRAAGIDAHVSYTRSRPGLSSTSLPAGTGAGPYATALETRSTSLAADGSGPDPAALRARLSGAHRRPATLSRRVTTGCSGSPPTRCCRTVRSPSAPASSGDLIVDFSGNGTDRSAACLAG